ncbi:MAG: TadE/TadG family type IV pilus assembly protein [Acidimicrobiales bacterium]
MRRARGDGGQASVELALVLPLVLMLLLAVVQLGLLVRDQILVVHAAREAAREAAVDPAPDAPRRAALASSTLAESRLSVTTSGRGAAGSRVRVEVTYRAPTAVPLLGSALGDLTLRASATMRVER